MGNWIAHALSEGDKSIQFQVLPFVNKNSLLSDLLIFSLFLKTVGLLYEIV